MATTAQWGAIEWGEAQWGDTTEGGPTVEAVADGPVESLAGVQAVADLPVESLDTTQPVSAVADAPVESLAGVAAVGDLPVESVPLSVQTAADFPVEILGRDPLGIILTWNELRKLASPLVLSWLEVPRELVGGDLPLTWLEREPLAALILTWSELSPTLQGLAEDDIQRPYGRATGTP